MSIQNMEQWLWEQAANAAKEWYVRQCRDIYANLYLYHKRGTLTVAGDKTPDGFELSTGKRIGPSGTKDTVMHEIYNIARRLPCLPD